MDELELSPQQAWDTLVRSPSTRLVDVRTEAEWKYVGEPDVKSTGRDIIKISWHLSPDMRLNPEFLDQLRGAVGADDTLFFICRSGGRSLAAAKAAKGAGIGECYSIAGGFEGDLDENGRRGKKAGWKYQGLPWLQT
ncbi:rhodanese-like domain-containing protein [Roseiarcaceae bacterium H3SJ34-1]|uniref:rhodanese-like domain-containing protein n=1 Tax=Terripilifer ovatus TaxID=3032367 RepID=UPI003AB96491|nr:rhodanese-like domain-containing protein [Roseiarcaceae bacterium H3SJ34-1]